MVNRGTVAGGVTALGIGIAVGFLTRRFLAPPKEVTEDNCRALGFIRPEECPEPCPPFEQIKDEGTCERCGGKWVQIGVAPNIIFECIPLEPGVKPGPSPLEEEGHGVTKLEAEEPEAEIESIPVLSPV